MARLDRLNKGVLAVGLLFLLCNVGWSLHAARGTDRTKEANNKYPYLSKRVFLDNPNDVLINFVPLRKKLEARFDAIDAQKSFYFEYLPGGTSIRIGDDKELIAASLIKLPLVMNLYRAAELHRVDLDKSVTVTSDELDNAYGDLWEKGVGTQLTLREAAQLALKDSDNTASHVVFDATKDLLAEDEQSLASLDIDQNMQNGQAVINAKSYGSVLKSLYLAAYLNKDDSEELMSYLAQSSSKNRLAAGVPSSVPIAHKIGVYNASWSESDCGIVYVPKRPYLICVMVGLPEEQANAFISGVSKDVYDFVSSQ